MQPLEGITVVALEQAIAAPFATRQLADLGARVVKVERPDGGDFGRAYDARVRGLASHFVWVNRGKESLTLDLKDEEARALLHRLVFEQADVFVQNLAPGAAARLGFDHAALARVKPSLVVCDISGYGADGPYRDMKAYDLLIQSEAGFLSVTGTEDEPAKGGIAIADIAAGMYAYSGILAALLERARTGRGRHLDISMLEALAEWMGYPLYYAIDGQPPPARTGADHATIAPYGPFPAGDGRVVMLGLQNEREWAAFCEQVLRRPELARDPRFAGPERRRAAREEIRRFVVEAFAGISADEVAHRLDGAGIAHAQLNSMRDVWGHPQLRARRRWREVDSPVGPLPALLPPGATAGDPPRMDAIPALGQHTEAILAELGCDGATVAALRARKAI